MPISTYERKLAPAGDVTFCWVRWQGPASYTQMTFNPVAGGDQVNAQAFGISVLELVWPTNSLTGNFSVVQYRISDKLWALKWISNVTATVGGQSQTAGSEAAAGTNLSAEYCKLEIEAFAG